VINPRIFPRDPNIPEQEKEMNRTNRMLLKFAFMIAALGWIAWQMMRK
jgi:hypothetical protein